MILSGVLDNRGERVPGGVYVIWQMIKSVEFVLYGYAVPGLEDRVVREASYIKWYSSCLVSLPLQDWDSQFRD